MPAVRLEGTDGLTFMGQLDSIVYGVAGIDSTVFAGCNGRDV
jgi:hypothetical protein